MMQATKNVHVTSGPAGVPDATKFALGGRLTFILALTPAKGKHTRTFEQRS